MLEKIFYFLSEKIIKKKYSDSINEFKKSIYFYDYLKCENDIKMTLKATTYWHGTGRYLYSHTDKNKYLDFETNQVFDLLKSVAKRDGLIVSQDPWIAFAINRGIKRLNFANLENSIESISLANYRLYGLSYAITKNYLDDTYLNFDFDKDSKFWFKLILLFQIIKSKKFIYVYSYNFLRWTRLGKIVRKWVSSYILDWNKNVSLNSLLLRKTDIKDNYGIVFGIKNNVKNKVKLTIGNTESRVFENLTFDDISYVEVPYTKINETKRILGNKIKIFPTEFINYYYLKELDSKKMFSC